MSFSQDRWRFIVEEARTGNILSRDLVVEKPKLLRALSGPANIQFDINYREYSAQGIFFKPWGHWIHAEKMIAGERKIWASGLVVPSKVDKKSGVMHLEAQGFSAYMKKMPWLDNWNPLACDAFEPFHKVWTHLQSFADGNLGVQVYPAISGIEMLPGYAFDGNITNLNFFAEFIRAEDKADCGDFCDALARDIPFDYVEQSAWNADRTAIDKKLFLGYPYAGAQQDNLAFIQNENVIEMDPHLESEMDWASAVIVDGWFPGTEISSTFENADPTRFRRVVMQDDARLNTDERAAAWARKKLAKRQSPSYWDSIMIDPDHPNAPFGYYDVADRIWVRGFQPFVGDVNQLHKIIAIGYDSEQQQCQLTLKAEGAFDYDPIYFPGSSDGSMTLSVPATMGVPVAMGAPTLG